MPNLVKAPTFKIADRREILQRVYNQLFADKNCRVTFHGTWQELTPDEVDNHQARQTVVRAMVAVGNPSASLAHPSIEPASAAR